MEQPPNIANHSGELTRALNEVRHLTDQVQDLKGKLAAWDLDIDVAVKPNAGRYELAIVLLKNDGTGKHIFIDQDDVLYYGNDVATLVNTIAEEVLEVLFKQKIIGLLTGPVTRAVANIVQMKGGQK